MPSASTFLTTAFIALTVVVAFGIVLNVYLGGRGLSEPLARTWRWTIGTAVALTLWMAISWWFASTGGLANFAVRPPPIAIMVIAVLTLSTVLAFSRFGLRLAEGLPMWILVLGQVFRFPLELLMHRAADEGVMPVQMSYSGWNFDIVTGLSAIPVAWLLARGFAHGRALAFAWNVVGSLLLANILIIALVSTPIIAAFGPTRLNTWVAYPPFVWLPTVLVLCALTGHMVIFRKIARWGTNGPR